MKIRDLLIISIVVAGALALFALLTYSRLPAGAELPIHWNASGEPDGFAPALRALLMPSVLLLFSSALFSIIPRLEPLQRKLKGSEAVLRTSWIGLIALMVVIQAIVGLPAWGIVLPVNIILIAVGLLLVMIGNVLPKSRPGFFVGIRTPWAIIDEDNWIATHRLGGKLMTLAGLAVVVGAFAPVTPQVRQWITLGCVLSAAILPYIYSWWLWNSQQDTKPGGGNQ